MSTQDKDGRPGGHSPFGSSQQAVSPVPASVPDAVKVTRLAMFMGAQEEREAVVEWLRKCGDKAFLSRQAYRALYDAADAIENGEHREPAPQRTPPSADKEKGQ